MCILHSLFAIWVGFGPSARRCLWSQGMWKGWEDSEQKPAVLPQLELKKQCSWHPGIQLKNTSNYRRSNGLPEV